MILASAVTNPSVCVEVSILAETSTLRYNDVGSGVGCSTSDTSTQNSPIQSSMDVDDIKRAIVDLDLQAVGRAIGEQSTGAGRAQDTVLTTTKQVIGWAGVSVCEASLSD
jgi:hypothetical protein